MRDAARGIGDSDAPAFSRDVVESVHNAPDAGGIHEADILQVEHQLPMPGLGKFIKEVGQCRRAAQKRQLISDKGYDGDFAHRVDLRQLMPLQQLPPAGRRGDDKAGFRLTIINMRAS